MNLFHSRLPLISLAIVLWLASQWSHANANIIDTLEWDLKKEVPEIQIFSANVPDSPHTAILSVTTIAKDTKTIAQLIRDTNTCQQWVYRCHHSRVHQQLNEQEAYIYTTSNIAILK